MLKDVKNEDVKKCKFFLQNLKEKKMSKNLDTKF